MRTAPAAASTASGTTIGVRNRTVCGSDRTGKGNATMVRTFTPASTAAIGPPPSPPPPAPAAASQPRARTTRAITGAATVRSPSSAVSGLQRPSTAATGSCSRRPTLSAWARTGAPSCAMPSTAVADGSRTAATHHGAQPGRPRAPTRSHRGRAFPRAVGGTAATTPTVARDMRWVRRRGGPANAPSRIQRPRLLVSRNLRLTCGQDEHGGQQDPACGGTKAGSADRRSTYADGQATRSAAECPPPPPRSRPGRRRGR